MFVGQGGSLLPEDRFVNVFHFHDPTLLPPDPAGVTCTDIVRRFYTLSTTGGNSVSTFISNYVSRTAKLIWYNLLESEPRIPHEEALTLAPALTSGAPEEVAVCLSYQGAPPVTPRRRGRIYIGPLSNSTSCIAPATTTTPAKPADASAPQLVNTLVAAADRMMAEAVTAGLPWCIRSTVPTENFVPIVSGHVDNAFDTQRRRGPAPTARQTFT
jgi:hypothetical protein